MICLTGYGRADDVDYRKCLDALLLAFAQSRERISRLSGLADDYDHGIGRKRHVPVSEFRSKLASYRNAGEFLDDILGRRTDMICRTAGNDIDLGQIPHLFCRKACLREIYHILLAFGADY